MSAPGYAAVAFRVAARALRNAKGLKNNEGALRQQDVFFGEFRSRANAFTASLHGKRRIPFRQFPWGSM